MPTFFIPELDAGGPSEEVTYDAIRQAARAETGHDPLDDRIFRLWWRRDGRDCEVEVGKPDPVSGQTVLAILDLGRHDPYLVTFSAPGGLSTHVLVGKPVYAVTPFAA
jgi:hypothetical protein